jgi:hypothetical protein
MDRCSMSARRGTVALLLGITLTGCAWSRGIWQSGRDATIPASAAVAAWVVTAPVGGLVVPLVIFSATAFAESLSRSASLSAGELQGSGAHEREIEDLKKLVPQLKGQLEATVGKLSLAERAASTAGGMIDHLERLLLWMGGLALAWFLVRNREHLPHLRSGTFWRALRHILVGGTGTWAGPAG